MKLKWQIYLIQLDVVFKTKGLIRNISVIQLSDRVYNVTFPLMMYIPSGNIDPKPGMSHYLPCLIAE
jgi:hypothetical protein